MKNFIENHKKGIGIFFIFIAVIFMAFYFLIAAFDIQLHLHCIRCLAVH